MTENVRKNIHIIYSIVLSIMLVVAGFCLIVACVGIYNSGSRAFTPESVAAAFATVAVPVYICLGLVLGGILLDAAFPFPSKKRAAVRQDQAMLNKLHGKLSGNISDPVFAKKIRKEQHTRKLHRITTWGMLAAGSFVFLCYGTNPANFHQSEITESMEKAMYILLPCMALPFGYGIFAAFAGRASIKRETELVKEALKAAPTVKSEKQATKEKLPWLRYALLVVAVGILVYGYFAGGTNDVLTKAINICTECVGLG